MWNRPMGSSRLPVSAEQLDNRNFISDERDLPRININFGQLHQYAFDIIKTLIVEIQNSAERNNIRCFAMNFFGANRFENPAFAELAQVFAIHVEMLCTQGRSVDPAAVIQGEVGPTVEAASGFLVGQFEELGNYVEAGAEGPIREAIRIWEQLLNQAQRALNMGGQRSNYGHPFQRQGNSQPIEMGMNRGGGMGMGRIGQGSMSSSMSAPSPANVRPSWDQNQPTHTLSRSTSHTEMGMNRFSPGAASQPVPTPAPAPAERTSSKPLGGTTTAKPLVAATPLTANGTRTVNPQRPFDHVVMADGTELFSLAAAPDNAGKRARVAYNPLHPMLTFNRFTHLRFIKKDKDGELSSIVLPKVDGMDYLLHEIEDDLRDRYQQRRIQHELLQEIPTHMLETRRLVPNESGIIAVEAEDDLREQLEEAGAPVQLQKTIVAHSMAEARMKARLHACNTLKANIYGYEFLEYLVERVDTYVLEPKSLEAVLALRNAKGFIEWRDQLIEMHKNDLVGDELYETLERRMNKAFQRYSKIIYQIPITTDDVIADIDDFLTLMTERFGETLTEKFKDGAKDVIRRACAVLTGERLSKYLTATFTEEERKALEQPAVFVDRYSVTELPWKTVDLRTLYQWNGMITPELMPEVQKVLEAVYLRTSTNDIHEHVLQSLEGSPIYTYRSPLQENAFMATTEGYDDGGVHGYPSLNY